MKIRSSMLRGIALSLSLANLCLYGQWGWLDTYTASNINRFQTPSPFPVTYIAILFNLLLVTIVLLPLFIEWKSRRLRTATSVTLCVAFLYAVNRVRLEWRELLQLDWLSFSTYREALGTLGIALVFLGGGALFLLIMRRYRLTPERLVRPALLVLLPVAIGHIGWIALNFSKEEFGYVADHQRSIPVEPPPASRVVWVVFDMAEQRSLFEDRAANLHLPEWDRLTGKSLQGTKAFSPGSRTNYSMSGYLIGKRLTKAVPRNGNDLWITPEGETGRWPLSETPTVFSKAKERKLRTAIAGWNHPYCRLLGEQLDRCFYHALAQSFADTPRNDFFFESFRFLKTIFPRPYQDVTVEGYRMIHEAGKWFASDPRIALTLIHYPIPHEPWIYDRATGKLGYISIAPTVDDYFGNLKLTDISLGQLREAMEKTDTWDSSTVLVTSDHWWWRGQTKDQVYRPDGKYDYRVPFLVKLPHQTRALKYTHPFNTVLIHDMMLDVLANKIRSPEELRRWLDDKRGTTPIEPIMEANIFG